MCAVPKGFAPTLLFSAFFLSLPIVYFYECQERTFEIGSGELDTCFNSDWDKALTVVLSFLAALCITIANDCVAWFNMMLFFHIGVEVYVLDKLYAFADDPARTDVGMVFAWVGFGTVIVHLIPFLIADHAKLLIFLAFVGMWVNTWIAVFMDTGFILITGLSSGMLLLATLLIACIDCVKTSMLSQLRACMMGTAPLSCADYEI
jgi:hypothetical protein